jgi:hypothetical protein
MTYLYMYGAQRENFRPFCNKNILYKQTKLN